MKTTAAVILILFVSYLSYSQDSLGIDLKMDTAGYTKDESALLTFEEIHDYRVFNECDMILEGNIMLKDVRIIRSSDSTFTVFVEEGSSAELKEYPVNDIKRVTFKRSGFWAGAGYGFLGSTLFWGIVGATAYRGGGHPDFGPQVGFILGAALGIPTGLVAGLIGELTVKDVVYNFRNGNSTTKTKRLKYILHKNK